MAVAAKQSTEPPIPQYMTVQRLVDRANLPPSTVRQWIREGKLPDGVVWAIAADKAFSVLRQDISIQANPFSAFSSDSTQIRGTMRVNFGFVQPDCVVQIASGGS